MARPMATRWRWPPDIALGRRSRYLVSCRISAALRTRLSISSLFSLGDAHAEGHVVVDRHMRIERVGLEHHGDAALRGRHVVDQLAGDLQLAAGDLLEAGDRAQQRRLAAAGRADEDDELARLDVEIDAVQDVDGCRRTS